MARILILALLVVLLVWLLFGRRDRVGGSSKSARAQPQLPTTFAQCAHCGVHLPAGEAVLENDTPYCSEAHRLAGPRR